MTETRRQSRGSALVWIFTIAAIGFGVIAAGAIVAESLLSLPFGLASLGFALTATGLAWSRNQ